MRGNKVFSNQQVKWQEEDHTRLNYQMLFKENEPEQEDHRIDNDELIERISHRDEKWKKRLKAEKEKSFKEGFEAGNKEGYAKAEKKIDDKVKVIKSAIAQGHQEWRERQKMIEPGVLDLAFDVCEAILGVPLEKEELSKNLEEKLTPIFRKLDRESRPVLKVSSYEIDLIRKIQDEHASEMTLYIEEDPDCNPGEFELETDEETIVHKFQEMLKEFKKNLSLPTWN